MARLPYRNTQLRGGNPTITVTTSVNATPELAPAADCLAWVLTCDDANTDDIYVTYDGRVPTSTDNDSKLAAGDVAKSDSSVEASRSTIRAISVTGTQTIRIRPRYISG